MATPCVLINSCSDFSAANIIKEILQVDTLPEGEEVIENVTGYDWHVDNKYYSADVKLCVAGRKTIGDETFADSVQAFVVYFDPNKEETFQLVKSWNSYLDQIDPEIKMLVCDQCTDNHKINRMEAQTWCIENGFELVELNADTESDGEFEDDFVETTGIKRIIQSLQAHTWPNLELKDTRSTVSPYIRQLMQEEHDAKKQTNSEDSETPENSENHEDNNSIDSHKPSETKSTVTNGVTDTTDSCENCDKNDAVENSDINGASAGGNSTAEQGKSGEKKKKTRQQTKEEKLDALLPPDDLKLFEEIGSEDPGGESFEKLFERFDTMKTKASSLPLEDRKKYAEKVAIAFWQAMGGDEDEIDLDSDD